MSARKSSKKRAPKGRGPKRSQDPAVGQSPVPEQTTEPAERAPVAGEGPDVEDKVPAEVTVENAEEGSSSTATPDHEPNPHPVVDEPDLEPVVDGPDLEPVVDGPDLEPVVDEPDLEPVVDEPAVEKSASDEPREDAEPPAESDTEVAAGPSTEPVDDLEPVDDPEPVDEPAPVHGTEPVQGTEQQAAAGDLQAEPMVDEPGADDEQPSPGLGRPAATSRRAWRRLGRAAAPRPTKANVLATVLAVGLGFAIAAQVRQTSIEGLEDLREDELIRILDTVDQDGTRLAEEIQTLRLSRDRLKSDTTSLTESRKAAQQRLESLAILTGTAPAKGPGIVLTIRDPEFGVTAPMLLDTLQELRDAGAEAVEINGVRIVANTYFTDGEGGIAISGVDVSAPYIVTAIGDGSTLASAMEIPGGVTNTVRSVGGEAVVQTKDEVSVTALRSVSEPQYARPIPSPTTS